MIVFALQRKYTTLYDFFFKFRRNEKNREKEANKQIETDREKDRYTDLKFETDCWQSEKPTKNIPEVLDFGAGDLSLLDKDHGGGDEGALSHVVGGVVLHRLQ